MSYKTFNSKAREREHRRTSSYIEPEPKVPPREEIYASKDETKTMPQMRRHSMYPEHHEESFIKNIIHFLGGHLFSSLKNLYPMEDDAWGGHGRQDNSVPKWTKILRGCLVEFIGDLIFIFIGGLSATSKSGVLGIALAHGMTMFVLISSLGHISGGHFNPVVTYGIIIAGGIHIITGFLYILVQILGGFVGALFIRAVVHGYTYESGNLKSGGVQGGIMIPSTDYPMEAVTCEIIFSFLLVLTVLMTAVGTSKNELAPLAIGLAITVDILAGWNISGASMNPTRSLGPALAYSIFGVGHNQWKKIWIHFVGPLIGSLIAALLYKLVLANKRIRWILK